MVEWRICSRFPDYEVSESGKVRRWKRGWGRGVVGPMKPYMMVGYITYRLNKDGKSSHVMAHRLVAEEFIGPKPFDKAEVCHNDGGKKNNHYSNLRWDTHAANVRDRSAHGTVPRGEMQPMAKITDEAVCEIRRLLVDGVPQREVGKRFGVSQNCVWQVAHRKTWSHVE